MSSPTIEVKLEDLPVNVRQVLVEGNSHTSPNYVYKHFKGIDQVTNVGELNDQLRDSLSVSSLDSGFTCQLSFEWN